MIYYYHLEVDRDRWACNLHHIHSHLRHAQSSSTNVTCILRHRRLPLYIVLDLFGISTNDIMSIVVDLITETLYGQSIEGLFQLDRQLFNYK